MPSGTALDLPQFDPFDVPFTAPEASTENRVESAPMIAAPGAAEEAEDLYLVELRYQDYLARRQVEELFERGELLFLGA